MNGIVFHKSLDVDGEIHTAVRAACSYCEDTFYVPVGAVTGGYKYVCPNCTATLRLNYGARALDEAWEKNR